jgi:hypothetical protein
MALRWLKQRVKPGGISGRVRLKLRCQLGSSIISWGRGGGSPEIDIQGNA